MASANAIMQTDETLLCCSCQKSFLFSVHEKQIHFQKGYQNKPKRCPACRKKRMNGEDSIADSMTDRDLLLEMGKVVGEMRIFVEKEIRSLSTDVQELQRIVQAQSKSGKEPS